jgi:hypothetical protein
LLGLRTVRRVARETDKVRGRRLGHGPSHVTSGSARYNKSLGFSDGNNLVVCPVALPNGEAGIKILADLKLKAGDPIAMYRKTYEFQFVHELAHVVGAKRDIKYGMPDCTELARGATNAAPSDRLAVTGLDYSPHFTHPSHTYI